MDFSKVLGGLALAALAFVGLLLLNALLPYIDEDFRRIEVSWRLLDEARQELKEAHYVQAEESARMAIRARPQDRRLVKEALDVIGTANHRNALAALASVREKYSRVRYVEESEIYWIRTLLAEADRYGQDSTAANIELGRFLDQVREERREAELKARAEAESRRRQEEMAHQLDELSRAVHSFLTASGRAVGVIATHVVPDLLSRFLLKPRSLPARALTVYEIVELNNMAADYAQEKGCTYQRDNVRYWDVACTARALRDDLIR